MSTDEERTAPEATEGDGQTVASRPPRPYWIGILIIAMGAVWLYGGMGLPQGARYAAVGPGLFVTIAGAGLVMLGIMLIVQIARGESFDPQDAEDAAANAAMDKRAFLTALLAAFLPVLLMRPMGLPFTAMVSFTLVARAFGSRRLVIDIATGAILGSLAWYLFSQLGLQLGRFFPPLGL
ncbi:MAG TPA: tripartite tricarboxylate transporter TctB family protein [Devosiaceae bacterium]|nr:tripartite tricarboxylate transporter TctB family protein [Devosiaceae bacterium]